jgi:hypothetical protein
MATDRLCNLGRGDFDVYVQDVKQLWNIWRWSDLGA